MRLEHSRHGIRLDKDAYKQEVQALKQALTVTPKTNDAFGVQATTFTVFAESRHFLYLPRHFPIPDGATIEDKWESNRLQDISDIDLVWSRSTIELRPPQQPIATRLLNTLHTHGGALLSLPCGMGKTYLSVWAMSQLRMKTLVVVHKEFLMTQFENTISKVCPGARVGRIQGKLCDVSGKHVVLGMLQTLSSATFDVDSKIRTMFDVIICDECHHIAARVFSKAMLRFPARYTIGLSATPERKDGLTRVVKWFVGDQVVVADAGISRPICTVRRHVFSHQCDAHCDYGKVRCQNYGKHAPLVPQMISDMTQCMSRTRWIVNLVLDVLYKEPERNILIVSDRVQHLRDMYDLIVGSVPNERVGMYIGCMKQCARDVVANECNVILGTYALTREGLDIQKLDTLVIATPTGDIVQTVGRILRSCNNATPLVLDVIDNYSVFTAQAQRRRKYFASQKYKIVCDLDVSSENLDFAFIDEEEFPPQNNKT